jgi:hypothetical protein
MRGRVGATIVAATLAAATPAGASHGGGGGPHDFAVGSAKNMLVEVTPYPAHLRVSAHLFGSDVSGHAVGSGALPNGEFKVQGEVTCLRVVGNRATIKYRFARTAGPGAPPAGWGVQVFVEDNGSGATPDGNATDLPLPPELFDPFAGVCELPRGPYNPVDSGNYVVHDAALLPLGP